MPRTCLHVILAVALTLTGAAFGDDPPSPASRLKAVQTDLADAEAAYWKAREKLPDDREDDPEVDRLREVAVSKQQAGLVAALEIARADPGSEVSFEALEWLLLQAPGVYSRPAGVPALEMMAKHHAANPKVGKAVARVGYYAPYGLPHELLKAVPAYAPAMELLKAVAEKNPDRAARGQAAMGLAWQAKRAHGYAAYKGNPEAARFKAEAERALESVVKDYDDCLYLGLNKGRPSTSTLGKLARIELFELRNLQPGNAAPDIEGQDLDGARFKLSDHRGKVVLLVFWGSWCGPCMAAVPHERELVERFKGRPFVLIGLNSDEDKAKALRAVAREKIPWRSFWNGPEGPLGPIAAAWNVRSWPTVYVIDHRGVIRHNDLEGEDLDKPLAKLIGEAEAGK
jgi:thiol-disulfide isomerase/thioredoxin